MTHAMFPPTSKLSLISPEILFTLKVSTIIEYMKASLFALIALALFGCGSDICGQRLVTVNDPTIDTKPAKLTRSDRELIDREVVPKLVRSNKQEGCEVSLEPAGVISGSFTRRGAQQTIVFSQVCQTGNGFGIASLVLIEKGKVVGNFVSNSAWTVDISKIADMNLDGRDEFALIYSGGLHQGYGSASADLFEFSDGIPTGLGSYKATAYSPDDSSTAWKLTASVGKKPKFFEQRFVSKGSTRWRTAARRKTAKLSAPLSNIVGVK